MNGDVHICHVSLERIGKGTIIHLLFPTRKMHERKGGVHKMEEGLRLSQVELMRSPGDGRVKIDLATRTPDKVSTVGL